MLRRQPSLFFSILLLALTVNRPRPCASQCVDQPTYYHYKCPQLFKYCTSPRAARIRRSCPVTCGLCPRDPKSPDPLKPRRNGQSQPTPFPTPLPLSTGNAPSALHNGRRVGEAGRRDQVPPRSVSRPPSVRASTEQRGSRRPSSFASRRRQPIRPVASSLDRRHTKSPLVVTNAFGDASSANALRRRRRPIRPVEVRRWQSGSDRPRGITSRQTPQRPAVVAATQSSRQNFQAGGSAGGAPSRPINGIQATSNGGRGSGGADIRTQAFLECCLTNQISGSCQALCNYHVGAEQILHKAVSGQCSMADADVWMQCASGGKRNGACCTAKGVFGCDQLCGGRFSVSELLLCVNVHLRPILDCHRDNLI